MTSPGDPTRVLRFGAAGLGRAFTLMLPTLRADPRMEARERFRADFAAPAYASVEELCEDPDVEVVYVATPHGLHAVHAIAAARRGKHVLVEKPMAVTLDECAAMVDAAERAGVQLVVGHSHGFDAPIARARELIASGAYGAVGMIHAFYFTDFLYRPRRPEELDSARGGGVIWNQAAHQVDIVRLLGGGEVTRVRAAIGSFDPQRCTEGAYAALLSFAGGAFASLVYSGHGHFDGDEFCGATSEMGFAKDPSAYGAARRALAAADDAQAELALKHARNYGGPDHRGGAPQRPVGHQHFGTYIVSCERADLRPLPTGVMIYGDDAARLDALAPPLIPRREVIDELHAAIAEGKAPLHDGRWARATLAVCLALRQSARERGEVVPGHQVRVPEAARSVG